MFDYERRGSGDPRRFRLSINPEILRDGKEDPRSFLPLSRSGIRTARERSPAEAVNL